MAKFEFYRSIQGAEYFAVEAETEEQALEILENTTEPYDFQTDTIFEPDMNAGFEFYGIQAADEDRCHEDTDNIFVIHPVRQAEGQ